MFGKFTPVGTTAIAWAAIGIPKWPSGFLARFAAVAVALALVSTPRGVQAQTYTWGGAGSSSVSPDYNLATNWSTGGPPLTSGQAASFSTAGNATVNVTAASIAPDSWRFMGTPAGNYAISGGAVSFGGTGATLANFDNAASDTISISNNMGGAGLSQVGASTLALSGTNSFKYINVTAGTLTNSGTMKVLLAGATIFGGALVLTGTGSIASGAMADSGLVTVGTGSGNAVFDISGTTSGASIQDLAGASDGTVKLGNQTLTITAAGGNPFNGAINGSGGLTLTFGGLILGGTNGYTGVTTISSIGQIVLTGAGSIASSSKVIVDGTLDISNTLSGASIKSLSGNGNGVTNGVVGLGGNTLSITAASDTFAGSIGFASETGGLILSGGTEKLTGTNHYLGTTTITGGTLEVDGSIATSSGVTVNSGGTLSGVGTVGNMQVNAGGIFAPGSGAAGTTMSVVGNLAFQSGAIYLVQVNPSMASSANVTGTATLGGATVNAMFASGSYVAKQYTILTATGGVSGTFGALVNSNLPKGFQTSLIYDGTHAYLDLALGFGPASSPNFGGGLSANQRAVGNALINSFNTNGGIPLVYGGLTPAGLTQASGELATGSQQTTFDAMSQFMGLLTDPFMDRGGGSGSRPGAAGFAEESEARASGRSTEAFAMFTKAPPPASFEQRWRVWAAGLGGSQSTDGNTPTGSTSGTSRVAGTAVGADYLLSPHTIAGFALLGGGTNFSVNSQGSGHSDLFQAGAYVRHTSGAAYVSAALAYGWQDITTDRTLTIAGVDHLHAAFNANAYSGRIEGGYRYATPWMGITPYAAAQVTTFDLPSYAEQVVSGGSMFALTYASKSVTDTRSELGIRTDKSFAMENGQLTLRSRLAWTHDFDPNRSATATFLALPGASFVVNGAAQAPDSALTTVSAEMNWLNGWSAAATFEGEFSSVTRSYAGKGVVSYAW